MTKLVFGSIFLILTSLVLSSCATSRVGEISTLDLVSRTDLHLLESCRIYDLEGKLIRRINGEVCYFNDDGSVLVKDGPISLSMYDPDYRLLWKKEINAHHQINRTQNGDYLVLAAKNYLHKNQLTRFDQLLRISSTGEIIGEFDLYKRMDDVQKKGDHDIMENQGLSAYRQLGLLLWTRGMKSRQFSAAEQEYSRGANAEIYHFNSIYEIPSHLNLGDGAVGGNIIVNARDRNIVLIMDPTLSRIEKIFPASGVAVHDVHFNQNGDLFFYSNIANVGLLQTQKNAFRSAVKVHEYPSMNLKFLYGEKDDERFFSQMFGGGEYLSDGGIIFSLIDHQTDNVYIKVVDKNRRVIKNISMGKLKELRGFQQVKVRNLTQFLKNNKWEKFR